MVRRARILALLALLGAAAAPAAGAQTLGGGARSFAMGGTGVAAAGPEAAPFLNPALTRFRAEDRGPTAALPMVSALGSDDDDLLGRADDFQDTLDRLQAALDGGDLTTAATLRPLAASQLRGINKRTVHLDADAAVAATLPMRHATFTLSARTYADVRAQPLVTQGDIDTILDPTATSADLDALTSRARVMAAEVSEIAATLAVEGRLDGRRVALGLSPKLMSVDVTNYGVTVVDFEPEDAIDDVRDEQFQRRRHRINADAGLAVELGEGATVGVAVRDLLRENFRSTGGNGNVPFTYRVRPKPTLGLAVQQGGLTFTADGDLWPRRPFSNGLESQFVRMGCEVELAEWARLRAGFAHDLRGAKTDTFSFGLGSAIGGAVRWDIGAAVGDRSVGAALQASFSF